MVASLHWNSLVGAGDHAVGCQGWVGPNCGFIIVTSFRMRVRNIEDPSAGVTVPAGTFQRTSGAFPACQADTGCEVVAGCFRPGCLNLDLNPHPEDAVCFLASAKALEFIIAQHPVTLEKAGNSRGF